VQSRPVTLHPAILPKQDPTPLDARCIVGNLYRGNKAQFPEWNEEKVIVPEGYSSRPCSRLAAYDIARKAFSENGQEQLLL
jgi:hypothetical protein